MKILYASFILLFASLQLQAQISSFRVAIFVQTGENYSSQNYLGVNPGNTIGLDTSKSLGVFRETLLPPQPPSKGLDELSNREVEVLNELVRGYTSKQIAEKLFISSTTVRDHLKSIYQKLHVHTRSEAVAKTLRFNPLTKK